MSNASHREAFLEIARAFGTPREKRTQYQRYITYSGLCYAIMTQNISWSRLSSCNMTKYWRFKGFWWSLTPANDQYRSLSAMLIAHMGEEEFRMLREEK